MRNSVATLLVAAVLTVDATGQPICAPRLQWQQTYGSLGFDQGRIFVETDDGGFLFAGNSDSLEPNVGNRTAQGFGGPDFWIVKTDAAGSNVWDRAYGSVGREGLNAISRTADGGFILAGGSSAVTPSGNKTASGYGNTDYWVVRIDASGLKLWDHSFGGTGVDAATSVQQTSDGGFVVAGFSGSDTSGNKTGAYYGMIDFWVVRLSADGQKLWDYAFGGSGADAALVVRETADGGFIVGGRSESPGVGNKMAPAFGLDDFWIVRLAANGDKLWDRSFGGSFSDELDDLVETSDGGFLLAGTSTSSASGNKDSENFGSYDFWVVRINSSGDKLWDRSYGGVDADVLRSAGKTADGGFILGGWSNSHRTGTKASANVRYEDYWLARISDAGDQLWETRLGTAESDIAFAVSQTADGGFCVLGHTYGTGGDSTSPIFGNGDFWAARYKAETPGDCDGDGVPDARDLCAGTSAGVAVNSDGCAIFQLCPCTNNWSSTREYVRCVQDTSAAFLRDGLITEAERNAIVEEAMRSNCPNIFSGEPGVFFGLTNIALGQARINNESAGTGSSAGDSIVTVSALGRDGLDGVTVFTGEADSGLFLYPDAPIWGAYSDEWFMQGKAYGRLDGAANSFISSLRVTKPDYEKYPVAVDLTPLAPESLTFQVFSNHTLIAEATTSGSTGGFTIFSATYAGPRGNPFWREPDGSVGAVVEFTIPFPWEDGEYYVGSLSGPFGDVRGDRVFVRANRPGKQVEFISRVDVTGYESGYTFSFLDERLGMFARPHKALGPVTLNAANRRLTIASFPGLVDNFAGVLIETAFSTRFDVNLVPLQLANPFSSVTFSGAGPEVDDPDIEGENDGSFAQTVLREENGQLLLSSYFSPVYFQSGHVPGARPLLRLKVFRNGSLVGSAVATNDLFAGSLTRQGERRIPEIVAGGLVTGGSNAAPHFALTLRHHATFTATDGARFRGNHIRIEPIDPATNAPPLVTFSVGTFGVPEFTITAESSVLAPPPMSITPVDDSFELSWTPANQPFTLESATSISGPFSAVTNDVEFVNDRLCITLPADATPSRFFRLRLSAE